MAWLYLLEEYVQKYVLEAIHVTILRYFSVKIGRPGYTVTKQYDPDTKQHSFLFEVSVHDVCIRLALEFRSYSFLYVNVVKFRTI